MNPMDNFVYLDYNATTPVDPRVLEAMMPYFTEWYGNPASPHPFGQKVRQDVDLARTQLADFIGADANELVYTSGATEAINLAIKGLALESQDRTHIVTVSTEHSAVLDTCRYLETIGFEVTYLPVRRDGLLDLEVVKNAIRSDTLLVSVMLVNNETGVIQPLKEIADLAHEKGAFFMSDATQAVGKMPLKVDELGIDLLAFSGHKFFGPKGVGGLYVRKQGQFHPKLQPLFHGGGHEGGLRSGTLNVPGIIGIAKAAEIASQEMREKALSIRKIRDEFEAEILKNPKVTINGSREHRLYNVSNLSIDGLDARAFVANLQEAAIATGSACTSMVVKPSHVLEAMGGGGNASLRISISQSGVLELIIERILFYL